MNPHGTVQGINNVERAYAKKYGPGQYKPIIPVAGRSVLLITHDLEGLDQLDEIVVLAGGRIAEGGTHTKLVRAGGVYHQLWQAGRCAGDRTR
jgi:hypothetical protein